MHVSIMNVDPNGRQRNYSKIPSVWLNSKVVSHEKHALCSAFHLRWGGGMHFSWQTKKEKLFDVYVLIIYLIPKCIQLNKIKK